MDDSYDTSDVEAYRVKVTVKNNLLLSAIKNAGYKSVSAFAKDADCTETSLGLLINLRDAPIKSDGEFSVLAKKVMEALGACPSDLWTTEQLNMRLKTNVWEDRYNTDSMKAILGKNATRLAGVVTYESNNGPEESVYKHEFSNLIKSSLGQLTPREAKVLTLRFGLNCNNHNLEQVAAVFNCSKERIRQIESKAIRKLRENISDLPEMDEFKKMANHDGVTQE